MSAVVDDTDFDASVFVLGLLDGSQRCYREFGSLSLLGFVLRDNLDLSALCLVR